MASKENIYDIGKNTGKLILAGAVLYGTVAYMEQRNQNPESAQTTAERGLVLTPAEVAGLRNYESLMAKSAKIEPTATLTAIATPVAIPAPELKSQNMEMMSAAPMTAEQAQLIEKYKDELPNILAKLNADGQQTEDLTIYYPIYREAQDKTGVPWYLTWIVHEEESTASRNASAFILGATHYGAMGRAIQFHPDSDVERASADYGSLANLLQRHPDDWREIIWGATALGEYIDGAGSVPGGLARYSAAGPAAERFQKFLGLETLLKQ